MKLSCILNEFDKFAPFSSKEEWDNVGLMLGDKEKDIKKALVCLDVTGYNVKYAADNGCDAIITHHPFIMNGIKRIDYGDEKSKMLVELIKNDIAVCSFHTNFDSAVGGINDVLCEKIGLENYEVSEPQIFRKGIFKEEIIFSELADRVKNALNTETVICSGDMNKKIKTVGVCGGSGASLIESVYPCDAFLTGEAKYHEIQNAFEKGVNVICAGHFETENIALFKIEEILESLSVKALRNSEDSGFSKII